MSARREMNSAAQEPTAACRVCGQNGSGSNVHCSRCGTPRDLSVQAFCEVTWTDIALATLMALITLGVAFPASFLLGDSLWKGRLGNDVVPAATAISVVNGWLLGVPICTTLWRWRERTLDGDSHHATALREYWQLQALCLLPIAMIGTCLGAWWVFLRIL